MRITELLTKDTINLSLKSAQKSGAIEELVQVLDSAGKLTNRSEFKEAILKREEQSTTGIGDGVAIPHAKTKAVKHAAIAFGRSVSGVNYESLDGQPAHLFFMIAATDGANNTHLEALARLATLLMKEEARKQLLEAKSEHEVLTIIDSYDQDEQAEEQSMAGKNSLLLR